MAYWLHQDLPQAFNDELEVFRSVKSPECFAEFVGTIVGHGIGDQDEKEVKT